MALNGLKYGINAVQKIIIIKELEKQFSAIAAILGDRSRSIMLWNLLDGKSYTATELASCAHISLQSASNHLKKMTSANILSAERHGRHKYFKFANDEVAGVIESMAGLIAVQQDYKKIKPPKQNGFTYARTCYDHLAGTLGVQVTNALLEQHIIEVSDKNYSLTENGKKWFYDIGISIEVIQTKKRSFAHQCLDWSERRYHIAGALGAALLEKMIEKDWVRKKQNSRTLLLTAQGKLELKNRLNLEL